MPTNFVIPEGYQTLASGKVLAVLDILDWADVKERVCAVFLYGLKSPCKLLMVIRVASEEKQAISGSVADDTVNGTVP